MAAPTLDQVSAGSSAITQINANIQSLQSAAYYGRRASTSSGLVFGYYGAMLQDGTTIANGTVTVGASTTTYVVVDRATGAVSSSTGTTNWNDTTNYMRMARLVSSGSGITTSEDHRPSGGLSSGGGGGGAVASVNGQTGVVVLDTDDVAEGSTNLYFTDERVDDRVASLLVAGANITLTYNDVANTLTIAASGGGGGGGGDVVGPASSVDKTLPRYDGTTGKLLQGSGIVVDDDNKMSGQRLNLNKQTGTTYTLQASDSGKVIECTNAAAITVTVPTSLLEGFNCTVVQGGAGRVTIAGAVGTTARTPVGARSPAQWRGPMIYVRDNVGGSAAEYVVTGDAIV